MLCATKIVELEELKDQKNHLITIQDSINRLIKKIKNHSFLQKKNFDQNFDLRREVEKISKAVKVKKVSLKRNPIGGIEEIKFSANKEKSIYEFISRLMIELPGVVQFRSIKFFLSDKNNINTVIQFKILTSGERFVKYLYNTNCNYNYDIPPIRLFEKRKLHKLFCTIQNEKAYLDNSWFKVGDMIDDYELISIQQDFIEIQEKKDSRKRIQLGSEF
jgi:hypothetical protein